ncbi:ROK family transcriptional regulator [Actinotalea fermentans]|uniref:ROK family transcriptional regulator n=1 Tax=Actinotalea fermentans TaxID=43671 RepID=UPI0016499711|nr:ROK family transcriptional regulator [Actinotalea fermentans]
MSAGTSRGLRVANRGAVLRALVAAGELSRAEIADVCELSAAAVATIVADLLRAGLVEGRGSVPSDGGRPIGRLGVRAGAGHLLGAEVADDGVVVELVDLARRRLDVERMPVDPAQASAVAVTAALRRALRAVRSRHPATEPSLVGLGLALPRDLLDGPLVDVLEEPGHAGELPVHAVARAAALAAAQVWHDAAGAPAASSAAPALVVSLGRDVDLAVVTLGRVAAVPGRWGHTTVVPNGRRCACGGRGCLVAYAGADALVEAWRTRGGEPPEGDRRALEALVAAADAGEAGAATALELGLDLLAIAIGTALTLTGADRVVLAGWAGEIVARTRGAVLATRAREAAASPDAHLVGLTACRVPDAGAYGAALLVLDRVLDAGGAVPARRP